MRIIRYLDGRGATHYGALEANGEAFYIYGDVFSHHIVTADKADIRKLLVPVQPPAIYCIGLNYRAHAEETHATPPEYPVVFLKPPSALQHPGDPIRLPVHLPSTQVDFECELAVVIGRKCLNVARADALRYVLGYTCANDVSARDWQKQWGGSQWSRGKSFDTFAPLGPDIATTAEITDPNNLRIRTLVNGEVMQDSNTSDMIFDVASIIEFLSGSTTLWPGTVIMTGTPQGVGMARKPPVWLKAGDTVTVEIEKIGELTNPVVSES